MLQHFRENSAAARRRILSVAQIHIYQQDMLALKTRVECFEPEERRDHQSRADHQDQRQRHLHDDQRLAEPEFRAFNGSARIGFHADCGSTRVPFQAGARPNNRPVRMATPAGERQDAGIDAEIQKHCVLAPQCAGPKK